MAAELLFTRLRRIITNDTVSMTLTEEEASLLIAAYVILGGDKKIAREALWPRVPPREGRPR